MLRLPEPENLAPQVAHPVEETRLSSCKGRAGSSDCGEKAPPVPDCPGGPSSMERPGRHRAGARRARNPLFRALPGGGEGGDAMVDPQPLGPVEAVQESEPANAWEAASEAWGLLGGWASIPGDDPDQGTTRSGRAPGVHGGSRPGGARRASTGGPGGPESECYACPIGALFSEARGARPETVAHLLTAAQELTAAARSLLESLETALGRTQGRSGATKVQRITLE